MRTHGGGRPTVIPITLSKIRSVMGRAVSRRTSSRRTRTASSHRRVATAGAALVLALLGAALGATLSEGLTSTSPSGPSTQLGGPLTGGAEEIGEGHLGRDVALSADGGTALIGAPNDDGNLGAAWVFTPSATPSASESSWTQEGGKLTDGEESTGAAHGEAAQSGEDGSGAEGDGQEGGGETIGEETSSESPAGAGQSGEESIGEGHFGRGVALSADGDIALVGAPRENGGTGAVWVFTRSGSIWTRQAQLTGDGESGAGWFGRSVAISADGDTALVGGLVDHGDTGAVWVFTRSGSTWSQQGPKLIGGGEESGAGAFGASVALSDDGEVALIGAPADTGRLGAVWVFTRSGSTWSQQGPKLTGGGEAGEGEFGNGVALSEDGEAALIGAPADAGRVGAAWLFTRSGSTWSQQGTKLTGGGELGAGQFGWSVALSGDGATALIGGDGSDKRAGAAWVFAAPLPLSEPPATTTETVSSTALPSTTGTSTTSTSSTTSAATAALPKQGVAGAKVVAGRVTLVGATVTVQRDGRAKVKLRCISAVACRGTLKLTLTVRARGRKRSRTTIGLGAVAFSLRPNRTTTVAFELNSAGRTRLRAAHGRLGARLTIVVTSPSPRRTQAHAVKLVLRRA